MKKKVAKVIVMAAIVVAACILLPLGFVFGKRHEEEDE